MSNDTVVATLLQRYVEQHLLDPSSRPDLEALCQDHPNLIERLRAHVRRYLELNATLSIDEPVHEPVSQPPDHLPDIEGFRTIERV